MNIVLVAAVAENGVIGRGNGLPWRLRSDLQHFRALTIGKPMIIGRKTFLAIGSRDAAFAAPGVLVAGSLDAAFAAARGDALRRATDEIIVAGGGDIYAQAMPLAARLSITYIHRAVDGDAYFPPIDRRIWREIARDERQAAAGDDAAFAFVTY
jgi:dihydrofolate reductase